jgi:hypothetical protein
MSEEIELLDGHEDHWQQGLRESALFVALVSPAWFTDARCQAQAAYAKALGKPFRILLRAPMRLPEDAFQGITDLQIATIHTIDQAAAVVKRWVEEYAP